MGDEELQPPDAAASAKKDRSPTVLRSVRSYLLPPEVRRGLELALSEVCDLSVDAGMEALDDLPAVALARAIADDLEAALGATEELEELVAGSSTSAPELQAFAAAHGLEELLAPQVETLRHLQEVLRPRLAALRERLGPVPPSDAWGDEE